MDDFNRFIEWLRKGRLQPFLTKAAIFIPIGLAVGLLQLYVFRVPHLRAVGLLLVNPFFYLAVAYLFLTQNVLSYMHARVQQISDDNLPDAHTFRAQMRVPALYRERFGSTPVNWIWNSRILCVLFLGIAILQVGFRLR